MTQSFRLLDIPLEVLIHILDFLPLQALHACQQSSRFLHDLVTTSIELQYTIARSVAQVTDDPSSMLPISDRLRMLQAREAAFKQASPSWVTSIPVPFQTSGVYDLSDGFLFFAEKQRKALRYIQLPSERPRENAPVTEWGRIPTLSPHCSIIDLGVAIQEHDLVVVATSTPTGRISAGVPETFINLELLTMSTPHRTHPQARGTIEVSTSTWGPPNVFLEVVGDYMVFGESCRGVPVGSLPDDHVYIYEWKTGKLRMKINAENGSYFAAVFLSPEVLMLPNTKSATLELWRIPSEQTKPMLALNLPRLAPGQRIRVLVARSEPNPSVYVSRKPSRLPFYPSVEDSIIVLHIHFSSAQKFLLFIHRRTLLALLDQRASGGTYAYGDWGPNICRWLNAAGVNMEWITTSSGQRCVLIPTRSSTPLFFFDFNPYKILSDPKNCIATAVNPYATSGLWEEAVGSQLKCHATRTTQYGSYHGASLDDERVIAYRKDTALEHIISVDVFYFGES